MRFTNNRLTSIQADKTLLGSIRLCRAQLKNIVKLLLCKIDQGVCGGLCGKGYQRGTTKKRTTLVVCMVRMVWVVWLV